MAGGKYRALRAREYRSLRIAGVSGVNAREYRFAVEEGGACCGLGATGYGEEAVSLSSCPAVPHGVGERKNSADTAA